ncbi:MAG: DUF1838 family protein [Blastocatellia bacterium]
MKHTVRLILMAVTLATAAAAQSFTPELFKQFVEMRTGTGEPVYWYCIGELYSYPDGKLLAKVEGIDTARLVKAETKADSALQISRKIFIYRDPATNEVLKTINGKPVQHIEYPYQQITYALRDGKLASTVVQGSGARLQTVGPVGGATAKRLGDGILFAAPLFLNYDTPRGKYEAYENYDFWVNSPKLDFSAHPPRTIGSAQYQLSWNRFGDLPPFFGAGKGVMQLVSYRVDKYADLPATMREYLEKSARMWMQPPRDLEEIRQLQKAVPQANASSN